MSDKIKLIVDLSLPQALFLFSDASIYSNSLVLHAFLACDQTFSSSASECSGSKNALDCVHSTNGVLKKTKIAQSIMGCLNISCDPATFIQ
ncbi:hypothetical protein FRX31_022905, partial [Thalictrum thalictroides]